MLDSVTETTFTRVVHVDHEITTLFHLHQNHIASAATLTSACVCALRNRKLLQGTGHMLRVKMAAKPHTMWQSCSAGVIEN